MESYETRNADRTGTSMATGAGMADRHGGSGGHRSVNAADGAAAFAIQTGAGGMYHGSVPGDPAPGQASHHWEFLYRVAERFGIPVVILAVVLWWARNDMIQPLLDAHFQFLNKMSDAHEKQVGELNSIGEKLDTLIRLSGDK